MMELSSPKIKKFLYFLKKSFSYISGNTTFHKMELSSFKINFFFIFLEIELSSFIFFLYFRR